MAAGVAGRGGRGGSTAWAGPRTFLVQWAVGRAVNTMGHCIHALGVCPVVQHLPPDITACSRATAAAG